MERENEMNRKYFKNVEKLSEYMIEKAYDAKYTVSVLFYEDAIDLLCALIRGGAHADALSISPVEYDGYNKEYYVCLADDMTVSVEQAFWKEQYLTTWADVLLIDGYANYAATDASDVGKIYEIYIGACGNDDCDCGKECKCDHDGHTRSGTCKHTNVNTTSGCSDAGTIMRIIIQKNC